MAVILSAIINAEQTYPECLKMMFSYYNANFVSECKELK